jgi:hypothetical protein
VKGLHHYHFTLLESELEKADGKWFHDLENELAEFEMDSSDARERFYRSQFGDTISEGDIIRVSGNLEISDVSTSLDMFGGVLSMMSQFQELDEMGVASFDFENVIDEDSELGDLDWSE